MPKIIVTLKAAHADSIYSPTLSTDEAERHLASIRYALTSSDTPELPWLGARGEDILDARLIEDDEGATAVFYEPSD